MPGIICPKGHGMIDNPRPKGTWPRCPICYAERNRGKRTMGKARKQRRERVLKLFGSRCSAILEDGTRCFTHAPLEIHHVDGDAGNDHPSNLVPVCRPHHLEYAGRPRSAFVSMPMPLIG